MQVWKRDATRLAPKPGNPILGGAIGAYAHVGCAADDRDEFVALVQRFLDVEGFELCEVEDVEPT